MHVDAGAELAQPHSEMEELQVLFSAPRNHRRVYCSTQNLQGLHQWCVYDAGQELMQAPPQMTVLSSQAMPYPVAYQPQPGAVPQQMMPGNDYADLGENYQLLCLWQPRQAQYGEGDLCLVSLWDALGKCSHSCYLCMAKRIERANPPFAYTHALV